MLVNPDTQPWYVVHTRAAKELMVVGVLEQTLALETYLPEVLQRRRGRLQQAPLFPGYLFARAGEEGVELGDVNGTPGVIRLVAFSGGPQPVPSAVVSALQRRVGEINAGGGLAVHSFHEGERVRIVAGPLEGLEAVFVGPMHPSERVSVLLGFIGRLQEVQVAFGDLEPLRPHPPRRTRGRGRPIRANER